MSLFKLIAIFFIPLLFNTGANVTDNKVVNPPYNFQVTNATSVGQNPATTWIARPGVTEFKVYRKRVGIDMGYIHIANTINENYTDACYEITDGYGPGDEDVIWYRVTALSGTTESNPSNAASVYGTAAGGPGCSI